jgi:hypothetical protein
MNAHASSSTLRNRLWKAWVWLEVISGHLSWAWRRARMVRCCEKIGKQLAKQLYMPNDGMPSEFYSVSQCNDRHDTRIPYAPCIRHQLVRIGHRGPTATTCSFHPWSSPTLAYASDAELHVAPAVSVIRGGSVPVWRCSNLTRDLLASFTPYHGLASLGLDITRSQPLIAFHRLGSYI